MNLHRPASPRGTWIVSVAICTLTFALVVCFAGCRPRTGILRTGPHIPEREGAPLRVRAMPPPVKVEAVPLRRNKDCFYRDGAWVPEGNSWRWEKGEWILPPTACYYAPPRTAYEDFGVGTALVHRPGFWHPRTPMKKACGEPKKCPAPQGE
jgi:hypothetical protein